jgi:hypothetical protein
MRKFVRNYKLSVPTLAVIVLGFAWLAFGYFGVHTLFIDKEVSEAVPTFDLPADATADEASVLTTDVVIPELPPIEASVDPEPINSTIDAPPEATSSPAQQPTEQATGEIVTEYSGQFESGAHPTNGQAVVIGNGTEQRFLRFENFETDNGPDLNVYLFNVNGDGSDFIDLGDLKGNIGEQNYEIPVGVDLDVYGEVSIWCVRFSVGFGGADLIVQA